MKTQYIIDSHAHTGYWPNLAECEDTLLKSNKKHNISFCLFSFDGTEFLDENDKRSRLVSQVIGFSKAYDFVTKNSYEYGMLCWIRPHTENNIKEVENFISNHRKSIYGLKFHPWCSRLKINSQELIPYFKLAEKFDLPILVHTATDKFSRIKYLEQVCTEWPHINFIAAHGVLQSDHKSCVRAMLKCLNLFCDTAWMQMADIDAFVKNKLMDRIMFGTDNPIDGARTLDEKIYTEYFKNKIGLPEEDYNKLMYKNAVRIYNISEKYLKK